MLKAIAASALLIAAAAPVQAACTQANIAGTWTAYVLTQDNSGQLSSVVCNLVINTAGAFSTANSSCTASGQTVAVQGSVKPSAAARCAYSGSLTAPTVGSTEPVSLTLSLDKQSAAGVTGTKGAGDVSGFSMVKTK